jgi:hypothetical protein
MRVTNAPTNGFGSGSIVQIPFTQLRHDLQIPAQEV